VAPEIRSYGESQPIAKGLTSKTGGLLSKTSITALTLFWLLALASFFADRLKHEAGSEPAMQASRGFALAFGRAPSDIERISATALIRSHGTAAFCRTLYNANEFVFVP
jgi:hypothetical protein